MAARRIPREHESGRVVQADAKVAAVRAGGKKASCLRSLCCPRVKGLCLRSETDYDGSTLAGFCFFFCGNVTLYLFGWLPLLCLILSQPLFLNFVVRFLKATSSV